VELRSSSCCELVWIDSLEWYHDMRRSTTNDCPTAQQIVVDLITAVGRLRSETDQGGDLLRQLLNRRNLPQTRKRTDLALRQGLGFGESTLDALLLGIDVSQAEVPEKPANASRSIDCLTSARRPSKRLRMSVSRIYQQAFLVLEGT
jgi:hypothetical protein